MGIELSNIVKKKNLRKVQSETLQDIADVLSLTAGPFGSNTILLHDNQFNEYSKDGHKVLSNIKFYNALESGIQSELVELTRHIVKEVGDGTTSTVLLANIIFKELCKYQENHGNVPEFKIIESLKEVVEDIKKIIESHKHDVALDDIYKICMISTNGNEEISEIISNVYKEYGLGVFIDVGISNTTDTLIKSYDGLTLEKGYPAAAYINNKKGTASIRNAHIYEFRDPIDTPEMVSFLEKIIFENIITHLENKDFEFAPTVIMCPSISRDVSSTMKDLETMLYNFEQQGMMEHKPPILVISGITGVRLDQFDDIATLCGCKPIIKYLDPNLQDKDIEQGKAPTIDTIIDWCGKADLVEADTTKTKFINPQFMFETDENGEKHYSSIYNGLIGYCEQELEMAYKNNENISMTGALKRRLNSLKANMVDLLIGGVTATDRDSVRDLVEDAVLNCRSSAKNGYGYGANFEGLRAANELKDSVEDKDDVYKDMVNLIYDSYTTIVSDLYGSVIKDHDKCMDEVRTSLANGKPINLRYMSYDDKYDVLCTINSDIVILDAISKIVSIMFTANQALLVNPTQNKYSD